MTALIKMKAKAAGPIPLSNEWSGNYLTDLEKVSIGAIAMGTTSPEAIEDLTGVSSLNVKSCLSALEDTGWNLSAALERQFGDRADNLTINQETYSILRQKGAFPCA